MSFSFVRQGVVYFVHVEVKSDGPARVVVEEVQPAEADIESSE